MNEDKQQISDLLNSPELANQELGLIYAEQAGWTHEDIACSLIDNPIGWLITQEFERNAPNLCKSFLGAGLELLLDNDCGETASWDVGILFFRQPDLWVTSNGRGLDKVIPMFTNFVTNAIHIKNNK